jgi:hypothetical protein
MDYHAPNVLYHVETGRSPVLSLIDAGDPSCYSHDFCAILGSIQKFLGLPRFQELIPIVGDFVQRAWPIGRIALEPIYSDFLQKIIYDMQENLFDRTFNCENRNSALQLLWPLRYPEMPDTGFDLRNSLIQRVCDTGDANCAIRLLIRILLRYRTISPEDQDRIKSERYDIDWAARDIFEITDELRTRDGRKTLEYTR